MKKIIALTLILCMLLSIGGVTVFAGTPMFDVLDHWKKNVVIFYNVDDIFNAATICYCADGSENWQSAEMTYGGKNEFYQDSWYFTMPEGKYRYYITDGTHRTQEQYFYFENLLYLLNETNENGYYELCLDVICGEYSDPTCISEMIADAANEQYFDPRHSITARDINVFDYYQFNDIPAFAVYFYVRNLQYIEVMIEERIGDWLLVSSHPEPFLFINDRLYGFKEAYDEGLMTDDMLAKLAASDFRGGCRYPILTRYIKGDADGDGEVSIIDATVIQRYNASIISAYDFYKPLGDVDGDSDVTVIDATMIQRKEAGMYTIA